jgi:acyl carrier protein
MSRDEIRNTFFDLLRPYVRMEDPGRMTESSLLVEDLGVNSTRFVDVVLETEDRFKIRVENEDIDRFRRVSDAIDFILERRPA